MSNTTLLSIKNVYVSVEGTPILKGLNLEVNFGEIHAIMGPNGGGKSTLTKVIAGHPAYEITQGSIEFLGEDITELDPEERARAGVFLAFQYPVEIPGVTNSSFLRHSVNSVRRANGLEEFDPLEFDDFVREKLELIDMDAKYLDRNVNDGFSGGEKKRNEILQMAVLNPKLALLDETDSGLDIDALKSVSDGINKLAGKNNGIVLVTHYQRLLNYIVPDFVHVLMDGQIVKSGGKELALKLEEKGYDWLSDEKLIVNGTVN